MYCSYLIERGIVVDGADAEEMQGRIVGGKEDGEGVVVGALSRVLVRRGPSEMGRGEAALFASTRFLENASLRHSWGGHMLANLE